MSKSEESAEQTVTQIGGLEGYQAGRVWAARKRSRLSYPAVNEA